MEITVAKAQGRVPVTILRLAGSLDGSTYEDLINAGIEVEAAGTTDLLLDMRQLTFMSSAGVVALQMLLRLMGGESTPKGGGIDLYRTIVPTGGGATGLAHLRLLGPTPDILRVLEVIGMLDFFHVYDEETEAVWSF
jgi:anti-anti-sigma regulatory factor